MELDNIRVIAKRQQLLLFLAKENEKASMVWAIMCGFITSFWLDGGRGETNSFSAYNIDYFLEYATWPMCITYCTPDLTNN